MSPRRIVGIVMSSNTLRVWAVLSIGLIGYGIILRQHDSERNRLLERQSMEIARDHNSIVCAFRHFIPPSKDKRTSEFLGYLITVPPGFKGCAKLLSDLRQQAKRGERP